MRLSIGTLTLNGSNSYSGGTTVGDGTLVVNGANAAGTGTITLSGGTLTLGASIANALNVTAPSALNPGGNTLIAILSGKGTSNINITGGDAFTVAGVMTNSAGMALGNSSGFFQFDPATNTAGSAAAMFDLGTNPPR